MCTLLASSVLLVACVKKESPAEETSAQTDVASEVVSESVTEFQPLEAVEETEVESTITAAPAAQTAQIETTETAPATPAAPKAEAPKAQDTETQFAPKDKSTAQSQDDAVADAMAAAMPALEN